MRHFQVPARWFLSSALVIGACGGQQGSSPQAPAGPPAQAAGIKRGEAIAEYVATVYSIGPGRVAMELQDSRGDWWFRSDGYGALRHDGESFTRFTKRDGLCSDTVWSIVEDRQGRVWFSCIQAYQPTTTGDGGVRRYDGETFTAFPEVKGLAGDDIYTLYPDRAGGMWIGATGGGVYRYDGEAFTLFDRTDRPDLNGGFGLQGDDGGPARHPVVRLLRRAVPARGRLLRARGPGRAVEVGVRPRLTAHRGNARA